MVDIKNEQEGFWAGEFGDDYITRNKSEELLAANLHMFSKILQNTTEISSITEFGCNIGMNFLALKKLLPQCSLKGVEINEAAIKKLEVEQGDVQVRLGSILDKQELRSDLSFTKGVLIHIHPENLDKVYENLYSNSKRYILIAEYYNPKPVSVNYRGYENKLFKRDFAGDMLDKYNDLELANYGFSYHRDPNFPQDDISWFLLKKQYLSV